MGSSKKAPDATRQERKAKKRALENAVPDLPGDADTPMEDAEVKSGKKDKKRKRDTEEANEDGDEEIREKKKEKKRRKKEAEKVADVNGDGEVKKSKKSKKEKTSAIEGPEAVIEAAEKDKKEKKSKPAADTEEEVRSAPISASEEPKKSKKERKAERKAKEAAEAAKSESVQETKPKSKTEKSEVNGSAEGEADKKSKKNNRNREKKRKGLTSTNGAAAEGEETPDAEAKDKKDARFICFIGNLPFTATQSSISTHFASLHPTSIRLLTQKDDPSKSKGVAFVEFANYDHMKTCLKLFHHSNFDDGVSAPRKINVELTAGGGGNTKERRGKIGEKNRKLDEERARRALEENKAKLVKKEGAAIDESAIHPSRRRMVPVA